MAVALRAVVHASLQNAASQKDAVWSTVGPSHYQTFGADAAHPAWFVATDLPLQGSARVIKDAHDKLNSVSPAFAVRSRQANKNGQFQGGVS